MLNRGKKLETDFNKLMSEVFGFEYVAANSGSQNGLDGLMHLELNKFPFNWYFECKDLNGRKHKADLDSLDQIEEKDFADKIIQTMGERSRDNFPHVFCLVIPHKHIGSNTNLRERLRAWNTYSRFPFKIIIWDFDHLYPLLTRLEHPSCKSIYPNGAFVTGQTSVAAQELVEHIKMQSRDGYLINRSYIKERDYKLGITSDEVLTIDFYLRDVLTGEGQEQVIEFAHLPTETRTQIPLLLLNNTSLREGWIRFLKNTLAVEMVDDSLVPESMPKTTEVKQPEYMVFDAESYNTYVREKKLGLVEILAKPEYSEIKMIIDDFVSKTGKGMVVFRSNGLINETIASLPLTELEAEDFGGGEKQIFFYLTIED